MMLADEGIDALRRNEPLLHGLNIHKGLVTHPLLEEQAFRQVDSEEMQSAKEQLKGHLMLALESTFSRMSRLAKGLLFEERVMTLEETLENIEAVTAEDLTRITARLLAPGTLTTTMLGAVEAISGEGAAR